MLDRATQEFVLRACDRRQVEISARLAAAESAPRKPGDPRQTPDEIWARTREMIAEAIREFEPEGLRVVRMFKRRPELVIIGSAATWRRFLAERRALTGNPSIEFRLYTNHMADSHPFGPAP